MSKGSGSQRYPELFLFDIFIAIQKIAYIVETHKDAESLLYDFRSWDSVIREFEIIGEATNLLLKKGVLSDEHRVIVDFRNRIIHHYFGIDPEIVWLIATVDLKGFEEEIRTLIASIDTKLRNELIEATMSDCRYLDFVVDALKELK